MLGELTRAQMNNLLSSQVIGRIGYTDGKRAHVVPVTFSFDGTYIYGQTHEGSKLTQLRKRPQVCFEVDAMTGLDTWQSVILYGTFEELQEKESEKAREMLFGKVYTLDSHCRVHSHQHEITCELDCKNHVKPVMYRIRVEKMMGKFEKP